MRSSDRSASRRRSTKACAPACAGGVRPWIWPFRRSSWESRTRPGPCDPRGRNAGARGTGAPARRGTLTLTSSTPRAHLRGERVGAAASGSARLADLNTHEWRDYPASLGEPPRLHPAYEHPPDQASPHHGGGRDGRRGSVDVPAQRRPAGARSTALLGCSGSCSARPAPAATEPPTHTSPPWLWRTAAQSPRSTAALPASGLR